MDIKAMTKLKNVHFNRNRVAVLLVVLLQTGAVATSSAHDDCVCESNWFFPMAQGNKTFGVTFQGKKGNPKKITTSHSQCRTETLTRAKKQSVQAAEIMPCHHPSHSVTA